MTSPTILSALLLLAATPLGATSPDVGHRDTVEISLSTLPLPLAGFAAEDHPAGVTLTWVSDFDDVTIAYDVERSADGVSWSEVATIDCGLTPAGPLGYSFADATPFAGLNHYRLVRRSAEGVLGVSSPIGIVHRAAFGLQVFPNPVDVGQPINLLYEGDEEHEFQIELVDVHGVRLKRYSLESDAGANQLTLDADVREAGVYFLQVFIDDAPVQSFVVHVK